MQKELKMAQVHQREHQETIAGLQRLVSERTEEVATMKADLETSGAQFQEKVWAGALGLHVWFVLS